MLYSYQTWGGSRSRETCGQVSAGSQTHAERRGIL